MGTFTVNAPTLEFIVGTRAALGVGIGLLISQRMTRRRRKKLGLTLLGIGMATTIPAMIAVRRGRIQLRSA